MKNKLASFHTSLKIWFSPLLILSFGSGTVSFLAILIKSENTLESLMIALAMSVGIAVFLSILFIIINYTYLTTVFTNGISSYDPFGSWKRDFMNWNDMKRIRRKNILGVKYYLIDSEELSSQLWIPVELSNKNIFIQYVGENAGVSHPLMSELLKVNT
jgi:hypothetical protein